MSPGADLFVVCKSCGSEVSAYITECPYCGHRLRKRAPKLDRAGAAPRRARGARGARRAAPKLGRLRPGEIPGIRLDTRPYGTIALVLGSIGLTIATRAGAVALDRIMLIPPLGKDWWRVLVAPFAYTNTGYLVCALLAIALFGWLLERRHGPWAPALVFLAGGAGGMAVSGVLATDPLGALGGNGAGLAMLAAWSVPDLRERRHGEETDSDMIGVAVIAGVLLLMPLAEPTASPVAGAAGGLIGLVVGLALAALSRER